MIIAWIMSGLALLAACVCLCMTVKNEKRSMKRNVAILKYVDETTTSAANSSVDCAVEKAKEYADAAVAPINRKIADLENGILPDYEQAKVAANAVNDFSRGISNILGFDPMKALDDQRKKEESGGAE